MHYHVIRVDYDTRNGHEATPVDLGVTSTYQEYRLASDADAKQFRLPSSDRFILHEYRCRPCTGAHP